MRAKRSPRLYPSAVPVRLAGFLALVTAVVAATAGAARGGTVLVVSGHGWGHGVGMSQWGAYGYALHGWTYRRILSHYYPGTQLTRVGEPRVRVLIAQDVSVVTVGCAAQMTVGDGRGRWWRLPAGNYGVGPKLVLPLRRAGRGRSIGRVAEFQCGRAPLQLDGREYHGDLVLRSAGGLLSAVDNLPLDSYVRGVVPSEMPSHWGIAALEAQAVAARSYALSELKPTANYDLLPDTRDQMYGGVAAERPRSDRAVYDTSGLVLTWHGQVARAYYSSSSGGRTEAVQNAWKGSGPIPYLVSVPDPWDSYSPHHDWGPFAFQAGTLASRLGASSAIEGVRLVRDSGYRVTEVEATLDSGATVNWSGEQFERALHLQSNWFTIGELTLAPSASRVLYGHSFRLAVHAAGVGGPAALQARRGDGTWRTMRHVQGTETLSLTPPQNVQYRLLVGNAATSVAVAVAPRVHLDPAGLRLLRGSIQPRPQTQVLVWRWAPGGWKVVARPVVGPSGTFATHVHLKPGGYKVTVGADGTLAATQTRLHVTRRLLASLPH
jgi:stage II sporulation protein D